MIIRSKLLFLILLLSTQLGAQSFFKVNSIPVKIDGVFREMPWEGGMNAPHFSETDLDFDGVKDVFVYDRSCNRPLYFKRDGNKLVAFIPPRIKLPKFNSWILLRDFDCDGKEDAFCYTGQGTVTAFKNISSAANGILFEETGTLLRAFYDFPGGNYTNDLYVAGVDLPSISDIDHDGDLDVLTFAFAGTTVEFFRNYSVEKTGACELDFILKNECWGYFEEGFVSNELLLHQKSCGNQVNNPQKSMKHSGSTLLTFDNDGDGIEELFLGDISFQNLAMLKLGKSATGGDSAVSQIYQFPNDSEKVDISIYPSSAYLDLTGDGIKDLVAAPNNPVSIENTKGVWLYKNFGSNSTPLFHLEEKGFLQNEMVDIGESTNLTAHDVDSDGKTDLVLGSRGLNDGSGNYNSSLYYFRNTGTNTNPSFELISKDLTGSNLGPGLAPAFGQLSTGTKRDLIVGTVNGQLHWLQYEAGNPTGLTVKSSPMRDASNTIIDVGDYSHPFLFDVNNDGKIDLVVGERAGNLNYFQNNGSSSAPSFSLTNDSLGRAFAYETSGDFGYSAPYFYKEQAKTWLILGTYSGKIKKYEVGSNLNQFTLSDEKVGSVYEGERTTPNYIDVNGDGLRDLILGTQGGGMSLYYQMKADHIDEITSYHLEVYPNPAGESIRFINPHKSGQIVVSDIAGRILLKGEAKEGSNELNTQALPNGIYLLRLESEGSLSCSRLVVQHP